jgi:23S rRNA pseudouridine1911/1915/1917 synthase
MDISILYEDKHILAINKPAGLVVHSDGRTTEATLVDWIMEKYPEMKEVGEPIVIPEKKEPKELLNGEQLDDSKSGEEIEAEVPAKVIHRPGIVHRLDRDTSGVLLIAKTQRSFDHLKAQFQDRDIKKVYNAFLYGEMKEEDGVIDRPIARSRNDFRLWSAQRGARGQAREAITHFKVLAKTDCGNMNAGFTYIEVRPKTGRTHQIRVHMKAVNHPVICDPLYAPKQKPALGFKRLALHARSIEVMKQDGELITIEAPYPEDFLKAQKLILE